MFDKLEDTLLRYEEVLNELSEPDLLNDQSRYQKLMKEQSDLEPVVEKYKEYKSAKEGIADSLAILDEETDEEMRELAKEELNECKASVSEIEQELRILLLPKDPNDEKNVIVEIRAGAGGDEAALFAADLYRMYCKYAEQQHWKVDTMNSNENGIGGFKEIVFQTEIRERGTPRTAYSGDRIRWTYPHFDSDRGNYAGSGGSRSGTGHERL